MKALILIGGEGTRLRPLTINTLKCMAPIANRPFIEYQFELLKKHGIHDVVLSVCHMPHKVKKAVGDGRRFGMRIRYADEKSPLGTGGAIRNSERHLDDTTVVMNGDILTDIDITAAVREHSGSGASVTIALHQVADPSAYGLVETGSDGRVRAFIEKPDKAFSGKSWINAGIYIFSKEAVVSIPEGRKVSVERETFPGIIASGKRVQSYRQEFYWLDIGRIEKYMQANFDVASGVFTGMKGKAHGKGSVVHGTVMEPSVIGSGVRIGRDARVENSVIWDKTTIGEGCVIRNSVIGSGCRLAPHCIVADTALADGSSLSKYTKAGGK